MKYDDGRIRNGTCVTTLGAVASLHVKALDGDVMASQWLSMLWRSDKHVVVWSAALNSMIHDAGNQFSSLCSTER